jgi:general secretion pathway protein I
LSAPPRAHPRQHGFTLLEVMVALAVIAIAFTALLGLHAHDLRVAAREEEYTQALLLARSMISGSITDATVIGLPDVGLAEGDFEDRYPGQYTGFRWQRTVSDTPFDGTRQVSIKVVPNGDQAAAAELTVFVRQDQAS